MELYSQEVWWAEIGLGTDGTDSGQLAAQFVALEVPKRTSATWVSGALWALVGFIEEMASANLVTS